MRLQSIHDRVFSRFPNMLVCYKTLAAEMGDEPCSAAKESSQHWSRISIDAILNVYAAALELRRKLSLRDCFQ